MYINDELLYGMISHDMSAVKRPDDITFTFQQLGELKLPTGKIIAGDPLIYDPSKPFLLSVTPGNYPVEICVMANEVDDRRVCAASLRFSDKEPARFELALVTESEAERLAELGDDDFFGYGVDTGTGGFFDASASKALDKQLEHECMDVIAKDEVTLERMLDETYVHTYSTANFAIPGTDMNVIAFSSGWGDGSYPSYWGFDADGNICCLVTDFIAIDDDDDDE